MDWLAFGPGFSAEDAAYDVLLESEAASDEQYYTITTISDLEKGFEKVRHDRIAAAAAKHGFPEGILTLALDMYRGARRIKCGNALSKATFTETGVLAGCPIAMGALCLAILDPMIKFVQTGPEGFEMAKI